MSRQALRNSASRLVRLVDDNAPVVLLQAEMANLVNQFSKLERRVVLTIPQPASEVWQESDEQGADTRPLVEP